MSPRFSEIHGRICQWLGCGQLGLTSRAPIAWSNSSKELIRMNVTEADACLSNAVVFMILATR